MSISVIDVAMIAQGMKVRQKLQGPTLLFLGARAGALFHSQTLYDELRPFSQHSFAPFEQIENFQACIRLLTQNRFSDVEVHSILLRSLQDAFAQRIDRYVAALAKLDFFQLIVTTNIDAGLEVALSRVGLQMGNDFTVFIPGALSSSSIPALGKKHSTGKPITLVKLYGELAIGKYSLKRRDKLFDGDTQLYQQLRILRSWNILMVGFDPVWDAATVPILFPCAGTLWYVNEETPSHDSEIFKYLQSRKVQCLLGVKGGSEKFFQSLHQQIVGSAPLPSLAEPEELPSARSRQSASTAQYRIDVLLLATTERELTAMLKRHYGEATKHMIQGRTCYDLGKIGDASVSLVQADEIGNALDALGRQIQELAPACIIILGTAWGFNYKGQSIGNLLVSDRIFIYDVGQESNTYKLDGNYSIQDQPLVPKRLLNLFRNGSIILNKKTRRLVPILFGPIFSSTEATDQKTAFRYVSKTAPDAIGIETRDSALVSLAQSYQENCLLVKSVSALVDVSEVTDLDAPDPESMLESAAQFILNVIALGGFHDPKHDNLPPA